MLYLTHHPSDASNLWQASTPGQAGSTQRGKHVTQQITQFICRPILTPSARKQRLSYLLVLCPSRSPICENQLRRRFVAEPHGRRRAIPTLPSDGRETITSMDLLLSTCSGNRSSHHYSRLSHAGDRSRNLIQKFQIYLARVSPPAPDISRVPSHSALYHSNNIFAIMPLSS